MEKEFNLYIIEHEGGDCGEGIITQISFSTEAEKDAYLKCYRDLNNRMSRHAFDWVFICTTFETALEYGYAIYDENGIELYCSTVDEDENSIS